jgi:phosphoribosyl 1,2-cyclic phosphodiesterase
LLVEAGPNQRTRLLIDAGISARLIDARLRAVGVDARQLRGVLVTHEHRDHIQALPALLKHHDLSVFTNQSTYQAIEESIASGLWRTDSGTLIPLSDSLTAEEAVPKNNGESDVAKTQAQALEVLEEHATHLVALNTGVTQRIGDIDVTAFPVSHDAVAPCGYLLQAGGCRVCFVTDSGEVTPEMLAYMQHADLLIIEANHDRQRLLRGPYPYSLKQRILSPHGHLSNDQTSTAILQTWRADSIRWIWLSHLSRTNNTPTLALRSIRANLEAAKANLSQVHISVAPPGMGPGWDSTQLWHTPHLWNMTS